MTPNGKTRSKRGKGLVKRFGLKIKKNAHEKLEVSMGRKPCVLKRKAEEETGLQ